MSMLSNLCVSRGMQEHALFLNTEWHFLFVCLNIQSKGTCHCNEKLAIKNSFLERPVGCHRVKCTIFFPWQHVLPKLPLYTACNWEMRIRVSSFSIWQAEWVSCQSKFTEIKICNIFQLVFTFQQLFKSCQMLQTKVSSCLNL